MNKNLIFTIIGMTAILGFVLFKLMNPTVLAGGSATGTTNSSPRIAQVVLSNTSTTTYTSILNTDSNDRLVVGVDFFLQGIGATSPIAKL